jgi:hypothetical protein
VHHYDYYISERAICEAARKLYQQARKVVLHIVALFAFLPVCVFAHEIQLQTISTNSEEVGGKIDVEATDEEK